MILRKSSNKINKEASEADGEVRGETTAAVVVTEAVVADVARAEVEAVVGAKDKDRLRFRLRPHETTDLDTYVRDWANLFDRGAK